MIDVCVLYVAKEGQEEAFKAILSEHAARLKEVGLISAAGVRHFQDSRNPRYFIEQFQWLDGEAIGKAHTPEGVGEIWERMDLIAEDIRPMHLTPLG